MARQVINIGSSANDGTGDPLRTAFDKINDNFVELYGGDNDINTLDANLNTNNFAITTGVTNGDVTITPNGTGSIKLGAMKFVGTTMSSDDSTQITIAENIQTTGTMNVAGAATLATSLTLASGATVTGILDEDNMGTNSATQLATQQSIKAYVDSQVTASDLDFACDDSTALSIDLDAETLQFSGGTGITTAGTNNTVTIAVDGTIATLTGAQTLTNKVLTSPTINGATMTGNVTVDNLIFNDTDISTASNGNLTLNPGGSGTIQLHANTAVTGTASVSSTLTTADITTTGNTTVSGNTTVAGVLTVQGSINADTIVSNSNGDITIDPAGTGAIVLTGPITATGTQTTTGQLNVDNLRLDGNTLSATSGGVTISPAAGQNVALGGLVTATEIQSTMGEFTTLRTDTLSTDTSNGNLTINTQGTGTIELGANTNLTGTLAVTGQLDVDGVRIKDNEITATRSNDNLNISSAGTGSVKINGISILGSGSDKGHITTDDSSAVTFGENVAVQGSITSSSIDVPSITQTGTLTLDSSTYIVLDADGGEVFLRDGSAGNYGSLIRAGSNDLTIASGSTQALIFTGANAAFQGNVTSTGTIGNSQITIEGNRIKTTASNADLQLETSGTGLIDIETPTQMTVGAVGAATHLPLDSANEIRPVGYLRIKISGTEYVIPYFNAS